MAAFREIEGGVTAPLGFRAAGVHAGIKGRKPDMALIATEMPARVAGVFTRNRIQGATVHLCRERLAGGTAHAVIVNSGNANACTGEPGREDARRMADLTAQGLGVDPATVFVCSTGVIGVRLPMDRVEPGITKAVSALTDDGGPAAARAIMTTDTVPKEIAVELVVDGKPVRIAGMAKGAGMIEPNMATMLCFITTDAAVEGAALQRALADAVELSFNKISVDGDQSCNDTVLVLANGAASAGVLDEKHAAWGAFREALRHVTLTLAQAIVRDGEGATKFVTVRVAGARSNADARLAVRAIANSLLVKTSWYGRDPNWGRVIDAVGYSGADVVEEKVDISFDEVCAVRGGRISEEPLSRMEEVLNRDAFTVAVDLHIGDGQDVVYNCDCSV